MGISEKFRSFILLSLLMSFSSGSMAVASENPVVDVQFSAIGQQVKTTTSISAGIKIKPDGSTYHIPVNVSPIYYEAGELTKIDELQMTSKLSCDPNTFSYPSNIASQPVSMNPEVSPTGLVWGGLIYRRDTGEEVGDIQWCKSTTPGSPQPSVAKPPNYSQIWQSIFDNTFIDSSNTSGAYVAPFSPGVTGLSSKFWAKFTDGQEIVRDATLPDGFRVRTSAKITSVQIYLTDPNGKNINIAKLLPNSITGKIDESTYENPIATYKFRKSGKYVLSTGVVWSAQLTTISASGMSEIVIPIGSIRIEINRDYQVNEILASLTK